MLVTEIASVMDGTQKGNRTWHFLGQRVSRHCLATLLGCRPQRFGTASSGHLDRRFRRFGAET